mgnify:FL=1
MSNNPAFHYGTFRSSRAQTPGKGLFYILIGSIIYYLINIKIKINKYDPVDEYSCQRGGGFGKMSAP